MGDFFKKRMYEQVHKLKHYQQADDANEPDDAFIRNDTVAEQQEKHTKGNDTNTNAEELDLPPALLFGFLFLQVFRSEERRVGKEC